MDLEIKYLDVSQQTSRVHPACLIDRVSPDVKHRFCCPDDPADQGPHRYPDPEHEVVERVLVDVIQLVVELSSEVYQVTQMIIWIILKKGDAYLFWKSSTLFVRDISNKLHFVTQVEGGFNIVVCGCIVGG